MPERDEEDEIAARQRNIRRLGRSGNWGSFVEDLAARFPLKHPVNLDAQDRLLRRIGDAKVDGCATRPSGESHSMC